MWIVSFCLYVLCCWSVLFLLRYLLHATFRSRTVAAKVPSSPSIADATATSYPGDVAARRPFKQPRSLRSSPEPFAFADEDEAEGPPLIALEKEEVVVHRGMIIEQSFGSIRARTDFFNLLFDDLASLAPRFWHHWFTLGVYFGLLAMTASLAVVLIAAYKWIGREHHLQALFASYATTSDALPLASDKRIGAGGGMLLDPNAQALSDWLIPVIPGINLPVGHIPYYFLALTVSSIFHEAGHAIAAASERVPVFGSGLFFYWIYPGAFVDISAKHVRALPAFRQMKIIAAGTWHNVVLALFAALQLYLLPYWLTLGYAQLPHGVLVTSIDASSVLTGVVSPGVVLTGLQDGPIQDVSDWQSRLAAMATPAVYATMQQGWCLSPQEVTLWRKENSTSHPLCLQSAVNATDHFCTSYASIASKKWRCVECDDNCYLPVLPGQAGDLSFFHVHYRAYPGALLDVAEPLCFFESPQRLVNSIRVSGLYPRFGFLPRLLPTWLESFLQYLVSLSLALSILNMVPAAFLDGQHMLRVFFEWVSPSISLDQRITRRKVVKSAIWACSLLMGVTTLISVYYTT